MGLLIQNGTVVTAEKTFLADILIEADKIKEIRPGISAPPRTQGRRRFGNVALARRY